MDRGGIAAGERVLDVGCGCGQTTLDLAHRVGSTGFVLGIDISTVMLDRARELARTTGLGPVRFENADAQTHAFVSDSFDVVFSRFGVMFFADPEGAFANLHNALARGGRLAFVCWRSLPENPWMAVPIAAALQHVDPPPILAPDAPGPFAFADAQRVRGILTGAGFDDVTLAELDETLTVGGGGELDRTVDFLLQMGPTAAALREASPAKVSQVQAAVREVLVPYHQDGVGVRMASASWIVSARRA
jgi:SAM-dependent methyltransferase